MVTAKCAPSDLSVAEICRMLRNQFGLTLRLDNYDVMVVEKLPEACFPDAAIRLATNVMIVQRPGSVDEFGRPDRFFKPILYIAHN